MLGNATIFLNIIVNYIEIILNTVGIIIILYSVVQGTIKELRKEDSAKHYICKGINRALNYNLATETLKIIVLKDEKDLLLIGCIIILKAMITALFILELKQSELQYKIHKNKKN